MSNLSEHFLNKKYVCFQIGGGRWHVSIHRELLADEMRKDARAMRSAERTLINLLCASTTTVFACGGFHHSLHFSLLKLFACSSSVSFLFVSLWDCVLVWVYEGIDLSVHRTKAYSSHSTVAFGAAVIGEVKQSHISRDFKSTVR